VFINPFRLQKNVPGNQFQLLNSVRGCSVADVVGVRREEDERAECHGPRGLTCISHRERAAGGVRSCCCLWVAGAVSFCRTLQEADFTRAESRTLSLWQYGWFDSRRCSLESRYGSSASQSLQCPSGPLCRVPCFASNAANEPSRGIARAFVPIIARAFVPLPLVPCWRACAKTGMDTIWQFFTSLTRTDNNGALALLGLYASFGACKRLCTSALMSGDVSLCQ
jgi:hypothetical protein